MPRSVIILSALLVAPSEAYVASASPSFRRLNRLRSADAALQEPSKTLPSKTVVPLTQKTLKEFVASGVTGSKTRLPIQLTSEQLTMSKLKFVGHEKDARGAAQFVYEPESTLSLATVKCEKSDEDCAALCDLEQCSILAPMAFLQRLKVGSYFGLWFALSVGYSVTNKRVTNVLPAPWSVATATVVVGSIFVNLLWLTGVRSPPRLPPSAYKALLPIGAFHAIGHIAGTVGTAAGSVSFAQVVKAAGPVYACLLSATVLQQAVSVRTWLSLLPIILGVGLATVKELSFAWAALLGAVISDLALALRNVFSKQSMGVLQTSDGQKLKPADMFGLLTCVSAAVSLPAALAVEGRALPGLWASAAAATPGGALALSAQVALTGLYFYGYSEVAMKALNNVHPVTHAIGNTMRRVVIMLVCMLAFRTPMTAMGAVGSALAISGAYLYAMTKHQEKEREKEMQRLAEQEAARVDEKLSEVLPLEVAPPNTAGEPVAEGERE